MWVYKNKEINNLEDFGVDIPYGFVYLLTHIPTNKKYIGRKVLYFDTKKKLTKKEIAAHTGVGRKPTTKKIHSESDWKTYYGSNLEIKKLIKEGKQNEFKREILEFGFDKRNLTYLETKYLFLNNVLEDNMYYNNNILGKFYKQINLNLDI